MRGWGRGPSPNRGPVRTTGHEREGDTRREQGPNRWTSGQRCSFGLNSNISPYRSTVWGRFLGRLWRTTGVLFLRLY